MGGDFDAGSHAAQGKSKFLLDLSCRDLWEVMDRKGGTELTWALPQSLGLSCWPFWRGQILLYGIWNTNGQIGLPENLLNDGQI